MRERFSELVEMLVIRVRAFKCSVTRSPRGCPAGDPLSMDSDEGSQSLKELLARSM